MKYRKVKEEIRKEVICTSHGIHRVNGGGRGYMTSSIPVTFESFQCFHFQKDGSCIWIKQHNST